MSAQISLFSFPKDGFYSFLQEHPCLAQGVTAAPASSTASFKGSFTKPAHGLTNADVPFIVMLVTPSSSRWEAGACCLLLER